MYSIFSILTWSPINVPIHPTTHQLIHPLIGGGVAQFGFYKLHHKLKVTSPIIRLPENTWVVSEQEVTPGEECCQSQCPSETVCTCQLLAIYTYCLRLYISSKETGAKPSWGAPETDEQPSKCGQSNGMSDMTYHQDPQPWRDLKGS